MLFVLAAMHEALIAMRQQTDRAIARRSQTVTTSQNAVRAAMHGASYFAGQVLMMVFMAYNGFFCASLVAGRAVGYFGCAVLWPAEEPRDLFVYGSKDTLSSDAHRSCCG